MVNTDKTSALMTELASLAGLPQPQRGADGSFHVRVGTDTKTDLYIYGGDEETVLIAAPLARLPTSPEYALTLSLLRRNLFDSDFWPFIVAVDDEGSVVFWGRVRIADFTGSTFSQLLNVVAERAVEICSDIESS